MASPDRLLRHLATIRKEHTERGGDIARGWMSGTRDMLESHGLGEVWHDPASTGDKKEWKERVAEAVEEREGVEREKRFEQMTSESSKRYERVKGWGLVTEEKKNCCVQR